MLSFSVVFQRHNFIRITAIFYDILSKVFKVLANWELWPFAAPLFFAPDKMYKRGLVYPIIFDRLALSS